MLGLNGKQLLLIGGAFLLIVLLFIAPTKLPIAEQSAGEVSEVDVQIDSAVALVNGPEPMKGILMLREIVTEYPENARAQFQMGIFSIQSGQFEKAVERLEKVVELDAEYNEAYLFLGHAYSRIQDTAKAVSNFERFKSSESDPELLKEVDTYINELKKH